MLARSVALQADRQDHLMRHRMARQTSPFWHGKRKRQPSNDAGIPTSVDVQCLTATTKKRLEGLLLRPCYPPPTWSPLFQSSTQLYEMCHVSLCSPSQKLRLTECPRKRDFAYVHPLTAQCVCSLLIRRSTNDTLSSTLATRPQRCQRPRSLVRALTATRIPHERSLRSPPRCTSCSSCRGAGCWRDDRIVPSRVDTARTSVRGPATYTAAPPHIPRAHVGIFAAALCIMGVPLPGWLLRAALLGAVRVLTVVVVRGFKARLEGRVGVEEPCEE